MPLSHWFRRSLPTADAQAPAGRTPGRACSDCQVALPDAARFCFICGHELSETSPGATSFSGSDDEAVATMQARLAHALGSRYRVREVLGKGGMGIVFLADDITKDEQVAIKVLRPELSGDETGVARFRREGEIAAML